jgi:hypothetical protein
MAQYDRVLVDIIGDSLMACTLLSGLVVAHADTIGYHFCEDFVLSNLGKFKRFEAKIIHSIQTDSTCFHFNSPN